MSAKKIINFLGVCTIATSLAACTNNIPDTIKVGVAGPLSGDLAPLGNDLLNGVKLAVEELNKAGFKVKGKAVTIEIVAVDDRANAQDGVKVAQQLVDSGVVAVIGHLNSGVSIPAAPIYAQKGIAQLSVSTNVKYTALGLPTTFRIVANDNLQAKALGSFAGNQLNGSKFAVVDDNTTYGKDLAEGAKKQLLVEKKTVVFSQSFDDKTTTFDPLAEKLKAENIDVLISTLSDFQLLALIDSLKKIDYTRLSILGGDTVKTTLMHKGAGILAGAIRSAESADLKAITAEISKLDAYAPVTGSMKFDKSGEQRYGAIAIYRLVSGAWNSVVRSDVW